MNGKVVKRGFNRYLFFQKAEKTFDKTFQYQPNFVETYQAGKDCIKSPKLYISAILGLPASEKALALKMLRETGIPLLPVVPLPKAQLTVKFIKSIQNEIHAALRAGSIRI